MRIAVWIALSTTLVSCGGSAPPAPLSGRGGPPASAVGRFAVIMQKGGSLYGVGVGCTEWRAAHSTNPDYANDPGAGDLEAQTAHEGRMYKFSYDLVEEKGAYRLLLEGRGGWVPGPDYSGPPIIGHATMCSVRVDVAASPETSDGVLVGDETWFLTKEACVKHRQQEDILRCASKKQDTPPHE